MKQVKNNYAPLRLNWKVPFGKYSALTVRELIDNDPSYFNWLNTTTVKFDDEVFRYAKATPVQRKNFDKVELKRSISRGMQLGKWQTIKIKPEDRNFDLKPEDFITDQDLENEEILIPYKKTLNFQIKRN